MGKEYQDLSRRALIQLNRDYDQESDAALLEFLTKNGDNYENIRPIEKVIDKFDRVKDSITGGTSIVKKTLVAQADKAFDSVIDALTSSANMVGVGLETSTESKEE